MLTNINRQDSTPVTNHPPNTQTTGATKMESTRKHNNTFLALLAAAVLTFVAVSATPTHAQSRGYWATDGCYYQHNGYGYQAIECQSYDTNLGTWIARTNRGTFYLFEGRWYDQQNYELLISLQNLAAVAKQQEERDAWNSYHNNQALIEFYRQQRERQRQQQKQEDKRYYDKKYYDKQYWKKQADKKYYDQQHWKQQADKKYYQQQYEKKRYE